MDALGIHHAGLRLGDLHFQIKDGLRLLGVIGEYLGRVFNETKGRPLYIVESHLPSA